jgi:hypothetical protein
MPFSNGGKPALAVVHSTYSPELDLAPLTGAFSNCKIPGVEPDRILGDYVVNGGVNEDRTAFAVAASGPAHVLLVEQTQAGCWELSRATAVTLAVALLSAANINHTIGPLT